ncbi:aspartate aminotransferase family protein [uncultured Paludibaculum sp.]|uniref:aspartate aminotransferase family protein n=1 Tax=uncultured Paludibaculum sp. TaxID=1765020 RepID=UPI002AAAA0B0|nr:aspartate aminotransferase family protein [uncultured Paludibaculum sp.]
MSTSNMDQLTETDCIIAKQQHLEQAMEFIPGGVNSSLRAVEPRLVPVRAEGAYFHDMDGTRYLDYHGAFGPPILGHSHPAVTRRVKAAIAETDQVGVGIGPLEIELAKKIVQHIPSGDKALLCNSGSEATYHAIRLSRAVTGRTKVIKFQGCYHGFHDSLAMNVITPKEKLGRRDPLSAGAHAAVVADTFVCEFNNLEEVKQVFAENPENIAAVILEPIPHNIGCVMPEQAFLEGLRALTQKHGTILIFDEVITGFRHSLGGYQKICGVIPDLTTLGKAIANGYPIAALAGRRDLMDRFNTRAGGDVFWAGTFNGHPVGAAAALATIEVLEKPESHQYLFALGDRMRSGLREIVSRHGVPATVAGFGSVFLTYFMEGPIRSFTDLYRNDAAFFVEYRRRLVSKGIFKLPMNLKRNHLSLSHTQADVDRTLEACDAVIGELKKK